MKKVEFYTFAQLFCFSRWRAGCIIAYIFTCIRCYYFIPLIPSYSWIMVAYTDDYSYVYSNLYLCLNSLLFMRMDELVPKDSLLFCLLVIFLLPLVLLYTVLKKSIHVICMIVSCSIIYVFKLLLYTVLLYIYATANYF